MKGRYIEYTGSLYCIYPQCFPDLYRIPVMLYKLTVLSRSVNNYSGFEVIHSLSTTEKVANKKWSFCG